MISDELKEIIDQIKEQGRMSLLEAATEEQIEKFEKEKGRKPNVQELADIDKSVNEALAQANAMMDNAFYEIAPHRVCAYIYQLSNDFNSFYHSTRIIAEEDRAKKESWIALLQLTHDILSACIGVLGFSAPERM